MANTLTVLGNGDVGFIDWLDGSASVELSYVIFLGVVNGRAPVSGE